MKEQVIQKIQECLNIAEKFYGCSFKFPIVEFFNKGTTSGTWNHAEYTMRFNLTLLNENGIAFINRTVPHEVAHLIDRCVNGYEYTNTGRVIRHGTGWKKAMYVLGVEPKRTHSYDTTNSKQRVHERKHTYKCTCKEHFVTTRKHNAMRKKGVANFKCSKCNHPIFYVGTKV